MTNTTVDIEQNEFHLLACMMIDKSIAKYIIPQIVATLFTNDFYRDLYSIIAEMTGSDYAINRTTVSAYLNERKAKGGQSYNNLPYHDILAYIQVIENEGRLKFTDISGDKEQLHRIIDQYIRSIKNVRIKERLESISQDIKENPETPSAIENIQRTVNELNTAYKPNSVRKLSDILLETVRNADKLNQSGNGLSGLSTGIADLDKIIGGLANSDLIIIAGRPGMGKTALATDIAVHVAKEYPVIFSSFEMSAEQLGARVLSGNSGVPSELIRNGRLTADDFINFLEIIKKHEDTNLIIDDFPPINLDAFYVRAKTLITERKAKLLIIDYLQLLRGFGKYQQNNKVSEITDISRTLKLLAKELDVPVIALSQLNRSSETRDDKRPQLSDLRDSGSIEQDADIVMFIYRESYYVSREEPQRSAREEEHKYYERLNEWNAHKDRIALEADVLIAKHRHGATGEVKLSFNPKLTRFSNYAKSDNNTTTY